MSESTRNRLWLGVALVFTAGKLWLSRGQGVYAIGSAGLDDRLFLELARHLVHGEWLGPYSELTLAKGPFYSLFIAGAFLVGVPLFLAQHLFYAAACALFARALRPALSTGARLAVYLLLLWNPMTFDGPGMGRVLRQQVYGPLALMIFAGLVAWYLRRAAPGRRQLPWIALAGLAAGAFYLTREEAIWLVPSVALLAGAVLFGSWRQSAAILRANVARLGLACGIGAVPVLAVCTMNRIHYGWFGTCELHAAPFADAYGAMLRVNLGPELPYVPVTRQAREAMARVSPLFAKVEQQFDAGIARGWATNSEFLTHLPPEEGQIGGGWLMWAFREAVAKAGYCHDARQAMAFYRDLANELNQACDRGALPARPPRHGFVPPWREAENGPFVHTGLLFADFVIRFSHFSGIPPPSTGSPEELQLFRDLTRERLSPPAGELDVVGAARYLLNLWKARALHATGKALRPVLEILFYVAQLVAFVRLVWLARASRWTFPLTVAAAAWGACAASVLMHAMIEVTSFPVLTVTSFAPIYPLLLVFIVAVAWDAAEAWRSRSPAPAGVREGATVPTGVAAESIAPAERAGRWAPWLVAAAAMVPFLVWQGEFRKLFWFGDDFFLLDELAQMGLRGWSLRVFAENFVPVFKVLWGGAVFAFAGSYGAMLWLLWLTHALNAALFWLLLRRAGFKGVAAGAAVLVFALTPVNIETLGWSVQWSAVLATSFLLLALWWVERRDPQRKTTSWSLLGPLLLFAAASACSFSRGVLTGPVAGLALVLPALLACQWRAAARDLGAVILSITPGAAVALVILLDSSGNHRHLAGHWGDVLEFGGTYFLLNPLHTLLGGAARNPSLILALAAAKLALIGLGLRCAQPRVRNLLLVLLAFDLGNAVLVGIGRYHTGFLAALSSRYQYSSLLAFLPFAAVVLAWVLDRLPWIRLRPWIVVVLLGGACMLGWPGALAGFTGWRGTELRQLLSAPATSDPSVRVPALEFMHVERAKALIRAYHLH